MQLTFTYTFEDYREANDAVFRSTQRPWFRRISVAIMGIAGVLLFGVVVIVSIANIQTGQSIWPELKRQWIMIAAAVYLCISALTGRRRALKRGWRSQPMLQVRQTIDVGAASLTVDDSQTRADFKWNAFQRFVETPNLFVLLPSEMSLVIVPKRAFTTAESNTEFRQILEARVQRPSPGFPVALATRELVPEAPPPSK